MAVRPFMELFLVAQSGDHDCGRLLLSHKLAGCLHLELNKAFGGTRVQKWCSIYYQDGRAREQHPWGSTWAMACSVARAREGDAGNETCLCSGMASSMTWKDACLGKQSAWAECLGRHPNEHGRRYFQASQRILPSQALHLPPTLSSSTAT